jgi:ParB/RepB/Spo0J family partition protein
MARAAQRAPSPASAVARETVDLPIGDLQVNPRNPRRHSDEQITRLMASLRTDGQTKPLLVRRENRMMIAGHGVLRAAQRLNWVTISAVLLDVDQKTADRIMLGDNRFSDLSTHDEERVAELLREIDEMDWQAAGFVPDEVKKALDALDTSDLVVREIQTGDLHDTFWISVRGPFVDQAQALKRLKVLMKEMPNVEVVLGTTDDLL